MKKTISVKFKKVTRGKDKQAAMYWGMMYYLECPYCKKTIIHSQPEEVKALRRWRSQKPLTKNKKNSPQTRI